MPKTLGLGVVQVGNVEKGSLLAFCDSAVVGSGSTAMVVSSHGRLYVPVGAKNLIMSCNLMNTVSGQYSYAQLSVGGLTSSYVQVAGVSWTWLETVALDVSSLSGWQSLLVEIATSSTGHAQIRAVSVSWFF